MNTINIGILAHVDAGKTTVTENLLYTAGAIKHVGRVDKGSTQTDSMELERKRGISIKATTISMFWKGIKINIIDTPGHVDFISEVERSIRILDGAILVISAKEGIQSQTRVLFDALVSLKIPTIIYINKLDRIGVSYTNLLQDLKEGLSKKIISLQKVALEGSKDANIKSFMDDYEIQENIIETLSELDDLILDTYVNGEKFTQDFLLQSIAKYCTQGQLYPLLNGSALIGLGIDHLLEALVTFFPINTNHGDSKIENPLSAVVFKIRRESNNSKSTYVRVYNGSIKTRGNIYNSKLGLTEKVTKVSLLQNGKVVEGSSIMSGDVGIIQGPQSFKIGDIIGMPNCKLKSASLAKPVLKSKVTPKDIQLKHRLYEILDLLTEEDPFLDLEISEIEKDIYINLVGNIQMEILENLLWETYGLEVIFAEPQTIYKEIPKAEGSAVSYMYQDKLNPFAATVGIKLEPLPYGAGFVYNSEVSTGFLPKSFQNAVEEAVYTTKRQGLLGWELTDIKVTFTWGEYDSVNSTPADFRNLTPMVFMEALDNAKTNILEPFYDFELKVPELVAGKAMNDIQQMRGVFGNPCINGNTFILRGTIPVDTCKGYQLQVASYTEGKGVFSTKFRGYGPYPLSDVKTREKTMVDPLNKKLYLMHKMNTLK